VRLTIDVSGSMPDSRSTSIPSATGQIVQPSTRSRMFLVQVAKDAMKLGG
jgi:hypothetical protein